MIIPPKRKLLVTYVRVNRSFHFSSTCIFFLDTKRTEKRHSLIISFFREMSGKTVFVTVGTTRFDRLIETIFDEQSNVLSTLQEYFHVKRLVLQTGESPMPENLPSTTIQIKSDSYKDSIAEDIESADLVISHAGAGTILQTLEAQKPLLVVVNEKLMNNHQLEIAHQMEKENYLCHCTCSTLADALKKIATTKFQRYEKGDPKLFGQYLNQIML